MDEPASTERGQAVDRRLFVRSIVAVPTLIGIGQRMRSLAVPDRSFSVGQVDSGSAPDGTGADVKSSVSTLIDGIEDAVAGDLRTFVGTGAAAECVHGVDEDISVNESEVWEQIESIPRNTKLATAVTVSVPGDNPNPAFAHAMGHAGISYTYDGNQWRNDSPSGPLSPIRVHADEVEADQATAAAVAVFAEGGKIVRRIQKTNDGSPRVTQGGEGADSPSVSKAGSLEIDQSIIDEMNNDKSIGVGGLGWFEDTIEVDVDPVIFKPEPGIESVSVQLDSLDSGESTSGADDTGTIHVDLSGFTEGPTRSFDEVLDEASQVIDSAPTGEPDPAIQDWIESGSKSVEVEVELPDSAHIDIAPPGEPVPEPPDDLSRSLKERLSEFAATANDEKLSIHYAFERPFADVVRDYVSTPGTDHYEQFQELPIGESMEVELPVLLESREDQAAATDAAALSRTEIGQGIALFNNNFKSLPLGSLAFGRKAIEFTPTPAGGPDTPIAVYTGPDGRIVPGRTRRGEPPEGRPDYEVTMPRDDIHAILRSPNPGEVATEVWDSGRVSVRPHGLMNQITYWLVTAALAVSRLLGF